MKTVSIAFFFDWKRTTWFFWSWLIWSSPFTCQFPNTHFQGFCTIEFLTQNLIQTRCCKFNSIFKTVKNRKHVQRYSRRRNFYKCQAMAIKFGGNVNDKCDNLTKKTELKSADSERHLVIIPRTFWSRWYIFTY